MKKVLLLSLLLISVVGCRSKYSGEWIDNGGVGSPTRKMVAVPPIKTGVSYDLPWDVLREITEGICNSLNKEGQIRPIPQGELASTLNYLGDFDYFSKDNSRLKAFEKADYVALLELVEHERIPYLPATIDPDPPAETDVDAILFLKMRMRLVDVRGHKPVVVYDGLLKTNHKIMKNEGTVDYRSQGWQSKNYRTTPIGIAHDRLVADVVAQMNKVL